MYLHLGKCTNGTRSLSVLGRYWKKTLFSHPALIPTCSPLLELVFLIISGREDQQSHQRDVCECQQIANSKMLWYGHFLGNNVSFYNICLFSKMILTSVASHVKSILSGYAPYYRGGLWGNTLFTWWRTPGMIPVRNRPCPRPTSDLGEVQIFQWAWKSRRE